MGTTITGDTAVTGDTRGVARNLGKGELKYAHEARAQNFKPRPLAKSLYHAHLLTIKVKVQIVKENVF